MHVKNRLCFLFLAGVLVFGSGLCHGQVFVREAGRALEISSIHASELSAGLSQRVRETFRQVRSVQRKAPNFLRYSNPTMGFAGGKGACSAYQEFAYFSPQDLYPHVPDLRPEELADYILAKQNLEAREWIPFLQNQQELLDQSADELLARATTVKQSSRQDMAWLAKQVTDETRYLMIGERHGFAEIPQAVSRLLPLLRVEHPNREIFVFTEFLPENRVWKRDISQAPVEKKLPVWQMAQLIDIPVIGLEPEFVEEMQDTEFVCHSPEGFSYREEMWCCLEGIRLRNERWISTLESYRQDYPNALFVVYAGAGHVVYQEPYSLGRYFASDGTLVAKLYPAVVNKNGRFKHWVDEFDALTHGKFTQRVLWFQDPVSARLAGFDMRIKIPVNRSK